MTKGMLCAGALAALIALPTVAAAAGSEDNGLYWGASITGFRYSPDGLDSAIKPIGGSLRLGYELTDRFAVEARAGLAGTDDYQLGAGEVSFSVPYYASVFGRFNVTTGAVQLYALLGGTYLKLDRDVENTELLQPEAETESGLSYGAGLEIFGTQHLAITAAYIRHLDQDDYYIDAWNLGFAYYF